MLKDKYRRNANTKSLSTVMYLSFHHTVKKSMCMRSKAWLAASVWLRRARMPPPASRVRRSRRLRDTLAAAPTLLTHASVTETIQLCPMGLKLRHTAVVLANRYAGAVPGCSQAHG